MPFLVGYATTDPMRLRVFLVLFWSAAAFPWFDPNDITVLDPKVTVLAELPSGHVNLKTYRATAKVLDDYSRKENLEGGDIKDFAKAPNCTRAEIHALKQWTTNNIFERVNKALRSMQDGKLNGALLRPHVETEILMIASAVNCAPQYKGPAVRVEQTPASILKQYKPNTYILARAFTSATKGASPAPTLEDKRYKITITETDGADVDSLGIAAWPAEKEVLVRPGTVFKIISEKENPPNSKYRYEWVFEQQT